MANIQVVAAIVFFYLVDMRLAVNQLVMKVKVCRISSLSATHSNSIACIFFLSSKYSHFVDFGSRRWYIHVLHVRRWRLNACIVFVPN